VQLSLLNFFSIELTINEISVKSLNRWYFHLFRNNWCHFCDSILLLFHVKSYWITAVVFMLLGRGKTLSGYLPFQQTYWFRLCNCCI